MTSESLQAEAILFKEIHCQNNNILIFQQHFSVQFWLESSKISKNNDHTCSFIALTLARSLWRCLNTVDSEIFSNSIKRHISDVKNSRLRQDIPISINDRVILPFREGFYFTKLRICKVSQK